MLLLVTDTSGKQGFIALVRAQESSEDSGEVSLIESVPLEGGTFSAQLVPQIADILAKHGFTKYDLGAFIVISGPGSFTGLRIGLAAIKALAEILHKPIVPVSLLEVIAVASGRQGQVFAALDAGRSEVYSGHYEVAAPEARCIREQLLTRANFLEASRGAVIATPHESLVNFAQEIGANVVSVPTPDAITIARVGLRHASNQQTVSPEQLEANYIRRSDAEIFSKPQRL